jgi:hypothetical protein
MTERWFSDEELKQMSRPTMDRTVTLLPWPNPPSWLSKSLSGSIIRRSFRDNRHYP